MVKSNRFGTASKEPPRLKIRSPTNLIFYPGHTEKSWMLGCMRLLLECGISLIGPECPVVPVESPPELKSSEQRSDSGNKEVMRVSADLGVDLVYRSALSDGYRGLGFDA
jgi:hypothetical protein